MRIYTVSGETSRTSLHNSADSAGCAKEAHRNFPVVPDSPHCPAARPVTLANRRHATFARLCRPWLSALKIRNLLTMQKISILPIDTGDSDYRNCPARVNTQGAEHTEKPGSFTGFVLSRGACRLLTFIRAEAARMRPEFCSRAGLQVARRGQVGRGRGARAGQECRGRDAGAGFRQRPD